MNIVKCLIDSMWKELEAANLYYHKILEIKDVSPQIASKYLEVASQELSHFDKFKNSLISNMQKIQEEHDKEIWEYENCKLSSWFDELRYKINKISL